MPEVVNIQLDDLVIDDTNARAGDVASAVELDKLVASIRSVGLLQPLVVVDRGGTYGVVAGRRRFLALQRIYADGGLPGNAPGFHHIPALQIDEANAAEASLAENYAREQMTTGQMYRAFKNMADAGNDDAAIADAFGFTEQRVARILRLATLAPEIMTAWEVGKIREDAAQAFATTTDHAVQLEVFNSLHAYQMAGGTIRRAIRERLAGEELPDYIVDFVRDEYVEAGGTFEKDLFDDSITVLEPRKLLDLVGTKLKAIKDAYKVVNLQSEEVPVDIIDELPDGYWRDVIKPSQASYASPEDMTAAEAIDKQIEELGVEQDDLTEDEAGEARYEEIEKLVADLERQKQPIEQRMIPVINEHERVRVYIALGYHGLVTTILKPAIVATEPKVDDKGNVVEQGVTEPPVKDELTARARQVLNGKRHEMISRGIFDADSEGTNAAEAHRALIFMLARNTFTHASGEGFCIGAAGSVYSNPEHRYRQGGLLIDGAWRNEKDPVEAFKNFPTNASEINRIAAEVFAEKVAGDIDGKVRTVPNFLSTVRADAFMARRVLELDAAFFELFRKKQILGFIEEALGGKSGFMNKSACAGWKEGDLRRKAVAIFNPRGESATSLGLTEAEKKKLEAWVPKWLRFQGHDAFASPKPKAEPKPKAKAAPKKKAKAKEKETEDA